MFIDKVRIKCVYLNSIGFHCWIVYGDHGFSQTFWDPTEAIEFAMSVYQSQKDLEETREFLDRW